LWAALPSLNGTYVNGLKIGQRQKHERPGGSFPEYDLKDGDEIQLGKFALIPAGHLVFPIVATLK
jgi:pSer/pThr/pTyr-binding forkhead associated (FHA) protein